MKVRLIFCLVLISTLLVSGVAFADELAVIDTSMEGDQVISADSKLLEIIKGNVTVEAGITFQVEGIVTGSLTLKEGAELILNGIVEGDLTLGAGATATINGIVGGNIYNNSGNEIKINGIVKGEIH
ncbi:MAG: hypothetical protein PWP57_1191 [Candidatus Atribacteria bacterium]|nr:hypothetical protein [Candidatus Atribacteria bacterium]